MSREITPAMVADVNARLQKLSPDARRQWGTMSAGDAVVHLTDALGHPLGDKPANVPPAGWVQRNLVRPLVLHWLPRYPQGAKTRADIDPHRNGTKPAVFQKDLVRLLETNARFVAAAPHITVEHPRFGPLTPDEWLRWSRMHTDHHLRQFGA